MTASVGVHHDALLHAATAARAIRPDVPLAMATLVDVEGSSFRQPGARLLVDAEQRCLAGAVSGGCLEADVAARAAAVCASGNAEYLVYDLRDDLQAIWGFDAACDGVAHILLEPLTNLDWLSAAVHTRRSRSGGALLTVVHQQSIDASDDRKSVHDAQRPRAKSTGPASNVQAITHALRARTIGVVGRDAAPLGESEARRESSRSRVDADSSDIADIVDTSTTAIVEAADALLHTTFETQRASSALVVVNRRQLRLFADPLPPAVALHVIGAGRGAEAFARIASSIGWQVTVVDHRPALLEALTLPAGVTCRNARPEQAVDLVADSASAVALMTHIFDIDRQWLEALLPQGHGYIGVLGSRQRAERLLAAVPHASNVTNRTPLHAPIGLDIGGESPESIALATIAEIHAVMHARPGGPLRERRSPIHDRTPVPTIKPEVLRPTNPSCRLPE